MVNNDKQTSSEALEKHAVVMSEVSTRLNRTMANSEIISHRFNNTLFIKLIVTADSYVEQMATDWCSFCWKFPSFAIFTSKRIERRSNDMYTTV